MENRKNVFYVGDFVKLANLARDGRIARIQYVFLDGQEVLLDTPLAGQTIWQVSELVLVSPARSDKR